MKNYSCKKCGFECHLQVTDDFGTPTRCVTIEEKYASWEMIKQPPNKVNRPDAIPCTLCGKEKAGWVCKGCASKQP